MGVAMWLSKNRRVGVTGKLWKWMGEVLAVEVGAPS